MDDLEPRSHREIFYQAFPRWFVDWVLAPFADESGPLSVFAKNGLIGLVFGGLLLAIGSESLLLVGIQAVGFVLLVLLLTSFLVQVLPPWDDPWLQ